jgi:hypothetical protein
MSLDLTVIIRDRISGETYQGLIKLLVDLAFEKGEFGFSSIENDINTNVYVHMTFNEDQFWEPDEIDVFGFRPESEILIASFHNKASHQKAYETSQILAKALNGAVYDHQVDVVYDADGKPYGHHRTDGAFEEFGAGAILHLEAVDIVRDLKPES